MKGLEKIIGYENEKEELRIICDIIKNPDIYKNLGAKIPNGLLLCGEPGVGKTLMAQSMIEECGINSYIIRRNKSSSDFLKEVSNIFNDASQNTPAIILLDDMDKFTSSMENTEEFSVIQSCIDEHSSKEIFVIATANCIHLVPDSLTRAGRIDKTIHVGCPCRDDAEKIIKHYLSEKTLVGNINISDISKMFYGCSCASLETDLNKAAVYAGYDRSKKIEMSHIVKAFLFDTYFISNDEYDVDCKRKISCHEAGHAVVADILLRGCIGFVSAYPDCLFGKEGFTKKCVNFKNDEHNIITMLASKEAVELLTGNTDDGVSSDYCSAAAHLLQDVSEIGKYGINGISVFGLNDNLENSDSLKSYQQELVHIELERYQKIARKILVNNLDFLKAVASALFEKGSLLNSEFEEIRNKFVLNAEV